MAGTIKYLAPIDNASGKIFGRKESFISVTRTVGNKIRGCAVTGKRNMSQHPETDNERQQKAKFSTIAKTVAEKCQLTSPTYAQDIAAYAALSPTEKAKYNNFRHYLWKKEWNKA